MASSPPPELVRHLAELQRLTTEPNNARVIEKYEQLKACIATSTNLSTQDLLRHLPRPTQISIAKATVEYRHNQRTLALLRKDWNLDSDRLAEQFPLPSLASKAFLDNLARLTPNTLEDVLRELEKAKATRLDPRIKNTRGVSHDPWYTVNDILTVKQLPNMKERPARKWTRRKMPELDSSDTQQEGQSTSGSLADQTSAEAIIEDNVAMRKRIKLTHPSASTMSLPYHQEGEAVGNDSAGAAISSQQTHDASENEYSDAEEPDVENVRCQESPLSDDPDDTFISNLEEIEPPPAYASHIPGVETSMKTQSENTNKQRTGQEVQDERDDQDASRTGQEVQDERDDQGASRTGQEVQDERDDQGASRTGEETRDERDKQGTSRASKELQPEGLLSHSTIWETLQPFQLEGFELLDIPLDGPTMDPLNLATTVQKALVPFNNDGHWILFSFSFVNKTAVVYNSLRSLKNQALEDKAVNVGKILAPDVAWEIELDQQAHQQTNKWDCGIHLMVTCLYVWADWPVPRHIDSKLWRVLFHSIACRSLPNCDTFIASRSQIDQSSLIAKHKQAQNNLACMEKLSTNTEAAFALISHLEGVIQTEQNRHGVARVTQLQEEVNQRCIDIKMYRTRWKNGAESRPQEGAVFDALNMVMRSAEKDLRDEERRMEQCQRRLDDVSSASSHARSFVQQVRMGIKQADQEIKDNLAEYKDLQQFFDPLING